MYDLTALVLFNQNTYKKPVLDKESRNNGSEALIAAFNGPH